MLIEDVKPVRPRPASRGVPHLRRVVAAATAVLLGAGGSVLAAESASAAPVVSTADGQFLSGAALGINLDNILTVEPADASSTGGAPVTDVHPLSVTALNAVNVNIGSGLNLLGDNGILTLGAVNQYAAANPDGSSAAASGAVTNTGGLGVGGVDGVPQSNATLDLSGLIGADLADSIADVHLTTGALSATATQAAGTDGIQGGDYQIAGLTLNLTSPALADTVAGLGTTLDGLQPTVNGVADTLNGLGLGVVTVTGLPNLSDTLDSVTDVTSADGSVTANLKTGAISVDVAAVLASQGLDLNNLPANTELLPYITRALTTQLLPALTQALTGVASQVTSSLQNVTATVAGIPIPAGTLLGAVTPVINQAVAPINTAAAGLGETVVTPLATALTTVLSLQANRQETAGGIFTERALRIGLLPTAATPAAIANLASASVGPNAGPAAALPTITGIDPGHGPTTGGTRVTVTGTGFTNDSTVSVDGGEPITPTAVSEDDTSLTFITPPHTAGNVTVTVTSPAGTSPAETYTYDPATGAATTPPPVITSPNDGSTVSTGTPPITGTGTPGATVTVTDGDGNIVCTATVRANGQWRCTPAVALPDGDYVITATQTGADGTSAPSDPVRFTVRSDVSVITVGTSGGTGTGANGILAYTGTDAAPLALLTLLLLSTGGALMLVRRHRRHGTGAV